MRKVLLLSALTAIALSGCAATQSGNQAQYMSAPMDYQIETVRQNFEEVKAQAQAKLEAERGAQAAAAAQKAKQEAAAA